MSAQPSLTTRNIRLAAQDLRSALDLPDADRASRVREAKAWLLSAADDYRQASTRATDLYFSAPARQAPSDQTPVDALAAILTDAQVGTTLIAAGHALGETDAGTVTEPLDSAIASLESADFRVQAVAALHFAGEPTHSPDFLSATQTLRARSEETLKAFVTEAHSAAAQILEKLSKIDPAKALEAVAQLGGPFAKLPDIGILVRKGLDKLQAAMDSLKKLLNIDALGEVKEKLTLYWNKLTDGTLADSLLSWAFGHQSLQAAVEKAAATASLPIAALDNASNSIPQLAEGFKSKMGWAKSLTQVIAAAAAVLLFVGSVAAAPLAAFTAGAYLLVLAAILLLGRDHAGTGDLFLQHHGLRAVVESLFV